MIEFEEGESPASDAATLKSLIGDEGEIVEQSAIGLTLRVPKADTARVTSHVLAALPVADLTVEDPPIDEVIERVFSSGREAGQVDQQARAPA